jgi:MFS family permease
LSESSVAVAVPRREIQQRRLSHAFSFAAVAAIFVLFMAASSAPSPLYVVYQQNWGFSATALTLVFAIYALGLIGSLLILGALSDHVGRRPVLAAAITLEAVSLVLFLVAGDVSVLFVARLVQGIATGAAMTTMAAMLVDLNPPHAPGRAGVFNSVAPISGLAVGSIGAGALIQFAPAPTHLVYALLLGAMVLAALIVAWMPETSGGRGSASALRSLRPKLGVPARLRPEFFSLVPIMIASWALGGLYLSLGSSIASGIFGLTNHLIGGLVVTLLCGVGALATFLLRTRPAKQLLPAGAGLLTAGLVVTLIGIASGAVVAGIVGTAIAGVGFGASALATFGTMARISAPEERGELFASAYVISYLSFSVPAVIAGLAATAAGLHSTAVVYASVLTVLSLLALGIQLVRTRRVTA